MISEVLPKKDDAPRLLPNAILPPYTYVPGTKTPHPIRHPEGHSHGRKGRTPQPMDPDVWHENRNFLLAIDLFNYGYYWEAHEQFEAVWKAVGRSGDVADFLKGLIKLSAAGVKQLESRPEGFRRHMARAMTLFELAEPQFPEGCGGLAPTEMRHAAQVTLESRRLALQLAPGLSPSVSLEQDR